MKNALCRWSAVILLCVVALIAQSCAKKTLGAKDPAEAVKSASGDVKEVVVASVNGSPIYLDALLKTMNRLSAKDPKIQTEESLKEAKNRALDRLIVQELAFQKAQTAGVKPDEKYVNTAIENFRSNLGGEKEYQAYLKERNVSENSLRSEVVRSLTIELMFAREVSAKIAVPDDELRKDYEREKDRYIAPEKVSVTDVVFLDKVSVKQAKAVLKKIRADQNKDPWKLMLDGTFIVRNYDIDKNRDKDKELYAAAKKLSVGELSGVIKTAGGLHIMKLKESSPERQLSFDEVKGSLEGRFRVREQQKRFEEWQRELKQNQKIEIYDVNIEPAEKDADKTTEKKN